MDFMNHVDFKQSKTRGAFSATDRPIHSEVLSNYKTRRPVINEGTFIPEYGHVGRTYGSPVLDNRLDR